LNSSDKASKHLRIIIENKERPGDITADENKLQGGKISKCILKALFKDI